VLSPKLRRYQGFPCFRHSARPEPQPSLPLMAVAKSLRLTSGSGGVQTLLMQEKIDAQCVEL